jgi:hypothetical protein
LIELLNDRLILSNQVTFRNEVLDQQLS